MKLICTYFMICFGLPSYLFNVNILNLTAGFEGLKTNISLLGKRRVRRMGVVALFSYKKTSVH